MENTNLIISPDHLRLESLYESWIEGRGIELSQESKGLIIKCRDYLDAKMLRAEAPIYGINTGFGSLYNISIEGHDLESLQENLVKSHACGAGEEVDSEIVKMMLLLKVRSLSFGHSGVRLEVVDYLCRFFNEDLLPVVYEQGSLGASGDLAPLAHLSLALLGEGEVYLKSERMSAQSALEKIGLEPLKLKSKEGLALLNGTQFMLAFGVIGLFNGMRISYLADLIGSISVDAFDGRIEPFDHLVHKARPHNGQIKTSERVREFLEGSELINRPKVHVQDPYSFRCIPQVHGATKDALEYVYKTFSTEINSVTDNPTIFPDDDKIISGGNFHGQTLALALDMLAIAIAELGNISERRTYLLVSGQRELPAFLVARPGLNSGLMIAQYTAASIVSQNKQYCTPASIDSIVSSNGQEDHVSMGANAATKAHKVINNVFTVLGIELMSASQALKFRDQNSSEFIEALLSAYRDEVPFINKDRILSTDIAASKNFISTLELDSELIF